MKMEKLTNNEEESRTSTAGKSDGSRKFLESKKAFIGGIKV